VGRPQTINTFVPKDAPCGRYICVICRFPGKKMVDRTTTSTLNTASLYSCLQLREKQLFDKGSAESDVDKYLDDLSYAQ
jgi:hypothetical protein